MPGELIRVGTGRPGQDHNQRLACSRTHARTHAHTRKRARTRTHARTHARTQMHVHARAHALTHTHTHTGRARRFGSWAGLVLAEHRPLQFDEGIFSVLSVGV